MTLPDLGSERPGNASETREMVERGRTETGGQVSTRVFFIALGLILAAIVAVALFLR